MIINDASKVIRMTIVSDATTWSITHNRNGTARFKKCKQLFENQHLLLETSGGNVLIYNEI